MRVIGFKVFEDLSKFKDSMMFDSDTIVASMTCDYKDHLINIDLKICGYVKVFFKGECFTRPSDFPEELKEIIKKEPNGWGTEDDIEVWENNWFEYIFNDNYKGHVFSDGIMFEDDLSKYSIEQLKEDMIMVCKCIVDDQF